MRQGSFTLGVLLLLSLPVAAQEPASPLEGEGNPGPVGVEFNARFDALSWWLRGSPLPFALASRNPTLQFVNSSGQVSLPGSLDQTGTEAVHGNSQDYGVFWGGRLALGLWFEDIDRFGMEASAWFLSPQTNTLVDGENGTAGSAVLARPFYAPLAAAEAALGVAIPGLASGRVQITSRLSNLWGMDSHAGLTIWRETSWRLDVLMGGRYQQMDDRLEVVSSSVFPQGTALLPTPFTLQLADQVATRVRFYGASLGMRADCQWGWFQLQPSVKLALGINQEEATLAGVTTLVNGATTNTTQAGFLVQTGNQGVYQQDEFSMIVEVGLNAGFQVTDHLRLTLGYTYLNWSNVARPGLVLDRSIALSQRLPIPGLPTPGQAAPYFQFNKTDFWAHGLNFGLEVGF